MCNLSSVRLGIATGVLDGIDYQSWQQIFIESGAGSIQLRAEKDLSQTKIAEQRAQFIREILNKQNK